MTDRSTLISRMNKAEGRVVDLSAQLRAVSSRIVLASNPSAKEALKTKRAGIERKLAEAKSERSKWQGKLDAIGAVNP